MRPWTTLDRVETEEGMLELRRRGEDEFTILVAGRVLMAGAAHRSEEVLATEACRRIASRPAPRVLIGGLGMGYTLRAALDALPPDARVTVAELTPAVVRWCRGPLAELTGGAVDDPRVSVVVDDVAAVIARGAAAAAGSGRRGGRRKPGGGEAAAAADESKGGRRKESGREENGREDPKTDGGKPDAGDDAWSAPWDAVVLDLYEGPRESGGGEQDPFFGRRALETTRRALAPGGVLAVWSEDPDAAFERRLSALGFTVERLRPKSAGPRHVVYLAS